jgi:spore coat polysaccharide biosynthesis protein SpsF (cytidylyltransferase family)
VSHRVVAVIQARTSSIRLPGKVLLPLAGRPVLARIIERLQLATRVHEVVIATSEDPSDDAVEDFATSESVRCFRGPLKDVLARTVLAVRATSADTVVRMPGDKPLLAPELVDAVVEHHLATQADYTTNMGPRWPHDTTSVVGHEVEVASARALERAHREATEPGDRAHVMPYLYRAEHGFRVERISVPDPLSVLAPRLTLDTPEDYRLIVALYDALHRHGEPIDSHKLANFLRSNPELLELNRAIEQRGIA